MSEQIGHASVGSSTPDVSLFLNTSDREIISVTLPGAGAVSYAVGVALCKSSTVGEMQKYTNATSVADEAVGTGDGSTTTFDLDQANVIASSFKAYSANAQQNATISVGTGTAGVDQVVFAVAPANAAAITADYDWGATAKSVAAGTDEPCLLNNAVTTTASSGKVITNGVVGGTVKNALCLDSAGAAVDSYFKNALKTVRFAV